MNNTRGQQITESGIAQRSGLEIFNTATTFNGEFINWGNPFSYVTQLTLDPDYTVSNSSADPHIDALTNAPQTASGQWMRYHTAAGSKYAAATAPISVGGYYIFNGINAGSSVVSYSGMYQRMSLTEGVDYQVEVTTPINTGTGVLYINVYTPTTDVFTNINTYVLYSTNNVSYPITRTSEDCIKSTFTAIDSKDIIVIYFTTLETSTQNVSISNISVKEKEEYLVPIYAEDMYGNSHKVLRIAADQTISDV
jgi:hypothetical protein